jgi:hypothetical protein
MRRHEFLTGLHQVLTPRSYLEIGVNDGRGLACSSTRTIGVDPVLRVSVEVACDLKLVESTSDDFFARPDATGWFDDNVIDLAFIDGMHLSEFVLRDFINTERFSSPGTAVLVDDMLPRTVEEAARDRITGNWTGDVFKVAAVLEKYRPDLVVVRLDTEPTGTVLVIGLDPDNRVLSEHYEQIEKDLVVSDPQDVPHEILHRLSAADPALVLASAVWGDLVATRTADAGPTESLRSLLELRGTAHYVSNPPPNTPWPRKKKAAAKSGAKSLPPGQRKAAQKRTTTRPKSVAQRLRAAIRR